jgi:hypothetical protein
MEALYADPKVFEPEGGVLIVGNLPLRSNIV